MKTLSIAMGALSAMNPEDEARSALGALSPGWRREAYVTWHAMYAGAFSKMKELSSDHASWSVEKSEREQLVATSAAFYLLLQNATDVACVALIALDPVRVGRGTVFSFFDNGESYDNVLSWMRFIADYEVRLVDAFRASMAFLN